MAKAPEGGEVAHQDGFGARGYRAYVLIALLVVYTFNFVDRTLLSFVQEQVKAEFHLSDFQLGLLGGATFALLYTLAGIPIAYLADRRSRMSIISVSMAVWSLMTAACGLSVNYLTFLLARVGVGIGEAGCTPPSQSVISAYFPSRQRATAIAIYSMGVPLGTMFSGWCGGLIAQSMGWRTAFIAIGLPGVLVALLVRLTVKEPPRVAQAAATRFKDAFGQIAAKPTFWWVSLGAAAAAFAAYGIGQYYTSFFIRTYGLSVAQASRLVATLIGVCGSVGVLGAGWLSDRLGKSRPNALAWLSVIGFLICAPMTIMTFRTDSLLSAIGFAIVGLIAQYFYLGGQYSITQGIVHPQQRATAVAILLFVVNLLGYALGPPTVGAISDHFANAQLAGANLSVQACKTATEAQAAACAAGSAHGLRIAVQIGALMFLVAAACFAMAWRTMQKDWWRG